MISIKAENIGLNYNIRQKISLSPKAVKLHATGGKITVNGRKKTIKALDNVSFELSAGDRLGLIGSNGAGKSTLLKVLYGIYEPSEGNLQVSGKIDALFNINLGFRKEATGRRNIFLRGLIRGWQPKEVESRMDEIIEFSELGHYIDLPLKSYSAGMAARLAFSIATNLEPEILLMDEWIGAGDPSFQEKAKTRMELLAEKAGIMVIASHNHKLLKNVCNKIIHLQEGKIIQSGAPDDLLE
ncbi:ABC transporter ATP-binding protein [Microbulbifer bruguierae]|uniref:ABC transporter ATP-binding protein n=1 Tax=Microbulbifer bruguierae TaxID=3029061 RepID=A0ABY8NGV6_9GAMM|nr:ABC transporter ATP-binding protein [Microbulbifer bruguierae]WGL17287.1 ABC transporter ATP-binding protein [Microbulbifer bruguierae]